MDRMNPLPIDQEYTMALWYAQPNFTKLSKRNADILSRALRSLIRFYPLGLAVYIEWTSFAGGFWWSSPYLPR